MRLSLVVVFFALALLSPQSAHATNYYVSSSGSSTASCATISTSCTFTRAQSLSTAGDTILIQDTIGAINITKPGLIIRGGVVDGSNLKTADSASILISADNTTLEDIEIINGWSYGFRTTDNRRNITARRLNIHHNVRENFASGNACKTGIDGGWGSAMRAYFTDGLTLSDSYIWENCGEGFSAVMSKNVHGQRLTLWDNWSVNAYPDQTNTYSLTDSSIYCLKPEFQRNTRNFSFLIGAEDSYGPTINITKNITLTGNTIYNCRGLGSYSQTTGGYENVIVKDNTFYNVYGPTIGSIPGTNIVTSPNTTTTMSPIPTPTVPPLSTPLSSSSPPKPWTTQEADYNNWLTHFLQNVMGFESGDFSENGTVDGIDYVLWLNHYAI